jgi:hypothetical protein
MVKFTAAALEGQVKVRSVHPGSFSAHKTRSSKRFPLAVHLKRHLAAVAC